MRTRYRYTPEQKAKAAAAGVDMQTVATRVSEGWDREKALTTPKRKPGESGRKNSRNGRHPWTMAINIERAAENRRGGAS
ncbi:hypothetical protein [Algiphilus aromaticivorans]|uniref:hypothetical protein n=1 Tax=Algiphilus aromaticivorans TaxID=382454 RepID=UPI0005C1A85B|nr:hypothetical protein [Algiphilus aromaticivorans]